VLAASFHPDAAPGHLQHRLAQHRSIAGLCHQRREPRQGRLRRRPAAVRKWRQTRRGTGRQPKRRVVAQRVGIVVVTPALRGQKNASADQRGEVMRHVLLAARILQARGHLRRDATAFQAPCVREVVRCFTFALFLRWAG